MTAAAITQAVIMATGTGVDYTVAMGADLQETSGDVTVPYDSRAGCRLNFALNKIQTGQSPAGGGAIVTWVSDNQLISPKPPIVTRWEVSWVEVSDDGVSAKVTPFGASTWTTWAGGEVWYATRTIGGVKTWVIDISMREILAPGDTDTIRVTMDVEGIV